MHKEEIARLLRLSFLATLVLCALPSMLLSSKLERRRWRSEYVSSSVMTIGGSDVSGASGMDIFSQNPALLYFQHSPTILEGYKRYLDEDYVFLLKDIDHSQTLLPVLGNFELDIPVDFFNEKEDVLTILDNTGLSSNIQEKIPAMILPYLSLVGITFNPKSGLTYQDTQDLNDAYVNLANSKYQFDIGFPIFQYIGKNAGFLMRNNMMFTLGISSSMGGFIPVPTVEMMNDFAMETALATRVPGANKLYFGLTFRVINRLYLKAETAEELTEVMNRMDEMTNIHKTLLNSLQNTGDVAEIVLDGLNYGEQIDPLYIGNGFSMDAGIVWQPFEWLRVGALLQDFVSGIQWWDGRTDRLAINFKVGASLISPWEVEGIIEDMRLVVDFSDLFFRKYNNFFLKTHIGAEASLFNGFADIRVGLNQGYPSFEISKPMDFHFMRKLPVIKGLAPGSYFRFFEKSPIFGWMTKLPFPLSIISDVFTFPDYRPAFLLLPPYNVSEVRRWPRENAVFWLASWAGGIVLRMNMDLSVGVYGYEAGTRPGADGRYQSYIRFNVFYESY